MSDVAKEMSESFVKLRLNLQDMRDNAELVAKIDTSAQGNTLPVRVFRQMFPRFLNAEGFLKKEPRNPVPPGSSRTMTK